MSAKDLGRFLAGIEDAGRGPVIGPLVIAGVAMFQADLPKLTQIGVRDSKVLSPAERESMYARIINVAPKHHFIEITPAQIDEVAHKGKKLRRLNYLEAKTMAEAITALQPDVAYVDASDVKADRFSQNIREYLPPSLRRIDIISEHHADRTYPLVSAASILAKVHRDARIGELKQQYGEFGSGYVTDPRTIEFLRKWRAKYGDFPPIVRRSWKTLAELEQEVGQSKLD